MSSTEDELRAAAARRAPYAPDAPLAELALTLLLERAADELAAARRAELHARLAVQQLLAMAQLEAEARHPLHAIDTTRMDEPHAIAPEADAALLGAYLATTRPAAHWRFFVSLVEEFAAWRRAQGHLAMWSQGRVLNALRALGAGEDFRVCSVTGDALVRGYLPAKDARP